MNFEILLVTENKNKLKEFREILSPYGIIVYSVTDLNLPKVEIEENGKDYFENALIKANAYKSFVPFPILADDSGIEVEAMNNKPGIFSARFAANMGGHSNAIKEILSKTKDNNKARFVCELALLNLEDKPLRFTGITNGIISPIAKGDNGFGYDPIFIPEGFNKTFSELDEVSKNKASHRGKAIIKLLTYLKINNLVTIHKHKGHDDK